MSIRREEEVNENEEDDEVNFSQFFYLFVCVSHPLKRISDSKVSIKVAVV